MDAIRDIYSEIRIVAPVSTLGATIRRLREERGLSRPALARLTGLSVPTISNIELGTMTNPTLETLERVAEGLGLRIEELFIEQEAGPADLSRLVEAFAHSELARALPGGPPTEDELRLLKRARIAYWGGRPPTIATLYHLLLAHRAASGD